ncbi:MAG: hypothetical protein RMJ56_10900 [Gemmataceae bacterium]|nr:hypothetical protein [Gemmata sp.]MDW8198097.1 hypothetical protein [Gemmataceae bacterium]
MRVSGSIGLVAAGMALGIVATAIYLSPPRPVIAASNDRYQDYIMATGAVSINPRIQTDGVWLLDYRAGKLLGTVIDRSQGKIVGWAEVDLTTEFNLKAQQDVHFLMTCGYVTQGQSALYLAETSTGQFGVYTMVPGPNGNGLVIRRHDLTTFRQPVAAPAPAPGQPPLPAPGPLPGPGQPPQQPPLPLPAPGALPAPGVTSPPSTNPGLPVLRPSK